MTMTRMLSVRIRRIRAAIQTAAVSLLTLLALVQTTPSYAAQIGSGGAFGGFGVSGALTSVTGWIMGLVPAAGGLMYMYHIAMAHFASGGDEMVVMQHKRASRQVLWAVGSIEAAATLVHFIV